MGEAERDARLDNLVERAERAAEGCLDCEVGEPHMCPTAPEPREDVAELIERSSLGTPAAKAARESVSDEQAARVVARAKELDREVEIAEVLAAHWPRRLRCGCGEILRWADSGERESAWAAHVAEALVPLIAERERAAWDEGMSAAKWADRGPETNPYRADRRAER